MALEPLVVLRWEWRAFGARFPDVERRILSGPHELRVGQEIYVVCSTSEANVKIRHEQLDVKRLERVNRGLELWRPVLKVSFPIDADAVTAVFSHWGMVPPPLERRSYSLDQFLTDVIKPRAELHIVEVTKERRVASIEDRTVEVATLTLCGQTVQTAAVESTDPQRVRRTVRALGFSPDENVNYVVALRRMLGIRPVLADRRAREGAVP